MLKNVRLCLSGLLMVLLLSSYAMADDEMDYVRQTIAAKGAKWRAAETSVSKLSHEQRKMKLGLNKADMPEGPLLAAPAPSNVAALPGAFDWRNYTGGNNGGNFVTPVRDQGQCGSCWAFATAATLESSTLIKNNTPGMDLNLAEQILVSCSGAGNCSGGSPGSASDFIKNTGLPPEAFDTYTATDGTCSSAIANWQASTYKISSWSYVTTTAPTVDAIKNALNTYGPVNTTMDVYSDFFYYTSGIYHYTAGTYQGGHAVLIVGYDDTNQYFICKNSWGTGWGEAGFFRIAYSELNAVTQFGDYTIAYRSGTSPPPPQTWSVTPSAGSNGTISPSTPQTVNNGASTWFTVTPVAGYRASVGGTCGGTLSGTTYTTNPIGANCTVTATFTATPANGQCGSSNGGTFTAAPTTNLCSTGTASAVSGTGPWTWTCAGSNGGTNASCQANQANIQTWSVTPSAGSNGTISPSTPQTVNNGASTWFTVTPVAGYRASVGGTCGGTLSGTTYTTNPIGANCTVTATFTATPANGQCGSSNGGTFTAAPTTNLCSAGTASAVSGTGPWTWTCAGSNGGTNASCQANQANPQDRTVTSSVTGGNGTISCTSPVNYGLSSTCILNANKGYRVATLTDNGSDVTSQVVGNVYTISTVTSNHVVIASFVTRGVMILWRNISTGENTVWYMNGSTHTASATLESLTGAWRMAATADFNNDGNPDILWRNISTGANMVWYMNGATHTGSADLTPSTDQNWKIVGTADFNNDGNPDILWRNISTGANMVWYMNGATHTGSADLTPSTDQNWKIVGTADFNSDGEADILWRNSATGQNVVWYMEGITRTGVALLDTVTDQNWKMIVGTTDLNNDGRLDILWRNTATGANMVWYMNGITYTAAMLDPVTDQNMEIAGQGNYSASPPAPPVNGQCGSSNGGTFTAAPTTNLCSAGTASAVSGTGFWSWTCAGSNGGTNASCQANQANIQTWSVTPSAGSNGTISPSSPQTINNGSTTSFTVTPAAGYTAVVGGTCGGTLSGTTYTTNPITTDCTVVTTFTSLPPGGVCGTANGGIFTSAPTTNLCSAGTPSAVTGSGPWIWTCQGSTTAQCQANPATLTVTSSVTGANGTISCTSPVNQGFSSTCTITPNKGYRLATLTDNGTDVTGQVVGNVYTIPAVSTNHVVIASFVTRGVIVFWRNISTGENTVWYMNGSTHTATATLESLTGAWRMVATADFNNDGNPDILWRNISTGANMVWYMNGATHTGSADLAPITDQNWKIVGTADFNNDGNPDILWRNISTGANMVWYMNGIAHAGSADLTPSTDQNWKIVGTADFNSDGEADILWRNSATGQNVVWYMEGITRTGVALLDTVTDQNWKMIVGTIDLNNDRKPDILWRNTATGANMVWYMNGITDTGSADLTPVTDQNMEIAGQGNN